MYKTIVVGTDGSDRAGVAFDRALALAKAFRAHLHIVHVVRDRPRDAATMDPATRARLEIDRGLDRGDSVTAAALVKADAQGVRGQVHAPRGDPADGLISVAHTTGADLVVVGNRGMGGLRQFVLGTVPARIAHRCPCSLLIVDTDPRANQGSTAPSP